jgi:hypothetical protein
MNGKIPNSVGFQATAGTIRQLSIRERLQQIAMSRQSGDLNHPMLGKLTIQPDRAQELMDLYSDASLIRLKRLLFMPLGVRPDVRIAGKFLCDNEVSIPDQIERLKAHKYDDELMDNVEGVQPIEQYEFNFTVKEFLSIINKTN